MVGERGVGEGTGGCREAEKQQSKVKVVVGGGGGWYERIFETDRLRRPCQYLNLKELV